MEDACKQLDKESLSGDREAFSYGKVFSGEKYRGTSPLEFQFQILNSNLPLLSMWEHGYISAFKTGGPILEHLYTSSA